ncbi:MAG: DMT family transporter [Candidatus Nealsonbacteria bacterium]
MIWLLPLGLYFLFFVFNQIIMKKISKSAPLAKATALRFLIAGVLIWAFAAITKEIHFSTFFLLIVAAGAINAFGAFCNWNAIKYSVSKTGLFSPMQDVIAVSLAVIFLDEMSAYNNTLLIPGVILIFLAAFILKGRSNEKGNPGLKWLLFVLAAMFIWGITTFLLKVFSFTVAKTVFLTYWYLGSLTGSLPILWLTRKEKRKLFPTGLKNIPNYTKGIPLTAICILLAMLGQYWTLQLAPASVALPIRSFGIILLPILVGWWIFKETKKLTKFQKLGFVPGVIGASLIIVSQL